MFDAGTLDWVAEIPPHQRSLCGHPPIRAGERVGVSKAARLYLPAMKLSLDTRHVGSTGVVRCAGRIVAGPEVQGLREHVTELIPQTQSIVLQLSGVSFLDSSGM